MIISLSGTPGSGKSTVCEIIAKKLKLRRYYIGAIRRELAKKRGLTLEEYNKLGEKDPSTDIEVDEYQKSLGKTKDNFIIEGRTSFYFIPNSIKIFIDVSLREGARRIFKDLKNKASRENRNETKQEIKTIKDVEKLIKSRMKSDTIRYKKYYNINWLDKKNFDFVIDTTNLTAEEAADKIIQFIKNNQKTKSSHKKTLQ